jgi:hypothetical protein
MRQLKSLSGNAEFTDSIITNIKVVLRVSIFGESIASLPNVLKIDNQYTFYYKFSILMAFLIEINIPIKARRKKIEKYFSS